MARKLVRQTVAITAGLIITAGIFFGLSVVAAIGGCELVPAVGRRGMVTGDEGSTSESLSRCAPPAGSNGNANESCSAVWRTGDQETAQCGFELARLQLLSDHDRKAVEAILHTYGIETADSTPAAAKIKIVSSEPVSHSYPPDPVGADGDVPTGWGQ